jgi:hypothetical protein
VEAFMRAYILASGIIVAALIWLPPGRAQVPGTSQNASEQSIRQELLAGTWILESVKLRAADGRIEEPYGPKAKGTLILEGNGQCAFIVANPDTPRPRYSYISTPEEAMAIAKGSWSFFGRYVADERKMMTFSIEAGSSPDLNGRDAYFDIKRITEQELIISRIPPPGGKEHTDFAYRRAAVDAPTPRR